MSGITPADVSQWFRQSPTRTGEYGAHGRAQQPIARRDAVGTFGPGLAVEESSTAS